MDNITNETAIAELERSRKQIHKLVDDYFDIALTQVKNNESISVGNIPQEKTLPISVSPHIFKGTKPIAVIFGDEQIQVKIWREVYTIILKRCTEERHDALIHLRNLVSGRKRVFLSDKPDDMNVPIMLADDLYAEAYFDTEYLMKTLLHILDAVQYDHSKISVKITERKYKFK